MFVEPTAAFDRPMVIDEPEWHAEARDALVADGDYVAYENDERVHVVGLQDGWTRIGRSLSAHVRFDDPTVSRRHALIHRDASGARILDDRSLNGVFVNGERIDWRELEDTDVIAIGAFRLHFIRVGVDSPAPHARSQTELPRM
jgi:pSer/pThr/pTyr-binding forkhead associated (FHA) protein